MMYEKKMVILVVFAMSCALGGREATCLCMDGQYVKVAHYDPAHQNLPIQSGTCYLSGPEDTKLVNLKFSMDGKLCYETSAREKKLYNMTLCQLNLPAEGFKVSLECNRGNSLLMYFNARRFARIIFAEPEKYDYASAPDLGQVPTRKILSLSEACELICGAFKTSIGDKGKGRSGTWSVPNDGPIQSLKFYEDKHGTPGLEILIQATTEAMKPVLAMLRQLRVATTSTKTEDGFIRSANLDELLQAELLGSEPSLSTGYSLARLFAEMSFVKWCQREKPNFWLNHYSVTPIPTPAWVAPAEAQRAIAQAEEMSKPATPPAEVPKSTCPRCSARTNLASTAEAPQPATAASVATVSTQTDPTSPTSYEERLGTIFRKEDVLGVLDPLNKVEPTELDCLQATVLEGMKDCFLNAVQKSIQRKQWLARNKPTK